MAEIVVEGVLFVGSVVTAVGLILFVLVQFTPLGLRIRQGRNRRRIEQSAEYTCPVHGAHAPAAMVRLPNGEQICPECFQEVVHD